MTCGLDCIVSGRDSSWGFSILTLFVVFTCLDMYGRFGGMLGFRCFVIGAD